jgi:hypothetical protein
MEVEKSSNVIYHASAVVAFNFGFANRYLKQRRFRRESVSRQCESGLSAVELGVGLLAFNYSKSLF